MDDNILSNGLNELRLADANILNLAKQMVEGQDLFPLDILANAVLNRSLALINGFIVLAEADNYLAAIHLIRLHLDSFLRFAAAWQVDQPHEFALKVLDGEPIRQLKDRTGTKMTDAYLVGIFSKDYPWIKSVYDTTSGYIHLSDKHIYASTRIEKEQRMMHFSIARKDRFLSLDLKVDAINGMIAITNCITQYVNGWTWTKANPDKLDELK
ncbi:hypothetical protein FY528_12035 [Hymenobacter lutimineralis]|uniref:Uncharacterized protein n=1 Tax=Hymenobacter lutimineralis TaxID=2606448 RepID=A0A5D6V159_9BACT|nr:hypothetical protein [Hymenobacter lutimineralis]TYZ08937.1 hypothetical protein FY528_12035 [Hymenobacter lutimineralis]